MAKPGVPESGNPKNVDQSTSDDLSDQIEKAIEPFVDQAKVPMILESVTQVLRTEESFIGPCPHPKHLEHYERILPGSADRLIAMAERDLDHRHTTIDTALNAQIYDMKAGRYIGAGVLLVLAVLAIYAGYLGQEKLSWGIFGLGALGVVTSLIKGQNKQPSVEIDEEN